jgi:hypothetical protein
MLCFFKKHSKNFNKILNNCLLFYRVFGSSCASNDGRRCVVEAFVDLALLVNKPPFSV